MAGLGNILQLRCCLTSRGEGRATTSAPSMRIMKLPIGHQNNKPDLIDRQAYDKDFKRTERSMIRTVRFLSGRSYVEHRLSYERIVGMQVVIQNGKTQNRTD